MNRLKTKVVCTIGPATWEPEVLKKLIAQGMTVARINASFADANEIKRVTQLIRSISNEVAVLLDLKGHKIRISDFGDPIELTAGQELILDTDPDSEHITVSYKNLHKDMKVGGSILIDDGKIKLVVQKIEGTKLICKVLNRATLKRLKTVNVPGTYLSFDPLTAKDKEDIQAGIEANVDLIAGSFVRDYADVKAIQDRIADTDIQIIAKIEDPLGVKNFDEILENVYGIMVARGDLGVEIPYAQVPVLQKEFIRKCNEVGKPVIVATHMLESMTASPSPTRAETSDVANAIFDGTDAIMLSAETSTGSYPVEAVETMCNIGYFVEPMMSNKGLPKEPELSKLQAYNKAYINDMAPSAVAISKGTAEVSESLPIKAIIMVSSGGFTARMLSRHKISQPIYAFVSNERVARKLALVRGVYAYPIKELSNDRDTAFKQIIDKAKEDKLVSKGDLVAITIGAQAFSDTQASLLELQKIA